MQTSKKNIIKSILFILLLIFCVEVINFILVPYSSMMKRFRKFRIDQSRGNIDLMVIGSSHEFDGFDGDTMSEQMSLNVSVFAPQGGTPETSYYCLLDALGKNNIKTVIIGWDLLDNFQTPAYVYPSNRRAQMYRELLKDSRGNSKLFFTTIKNMLDQRYTLTLFEYSSFPENLKNLRKVQESKKLQKEPWKETELTSTRAIDTSDIWNPRYQLADVKAMSYGESINKDAIKFVKKTAQLCKEKGINLFYIEGPYPQDVFKIIPECTKYHQLTKEFFKDQKINFIDVYDENFFPDITKTTDYNDFYGHFIVSGKINYTKKVCDWLKENLKN